jgi:chromosome segregation ATPase
MYIKRIVIEGFKTYKDRVIIDLDPGMTIIGTLLSPGSF